MRRHVIAATVVVVVLAAPSLAAAKGPASASISGPDVDRSLAIRGQGEMGPGTPLGMLVDSGGFFPQMYGESPDPTLETHPEGTLGPRYTVTYVVPGPNDIKSRVVQDVYPYAKPAPLTYMKAGQSFWGSEKTHGGWFQAPVELTRALVRAGLPATAPSSGDSVWSPGVLGAISGVFALVALAAVGLPLRRRARTVLQSES